MEIIFAGCTDENNRLVSASVLQIGKQKPILSVFDGEKDCPVTHEELIKPAIDPYIRLIFVTVVFPDGSHHRSEKVSVLLD